LTFYIVAVYAFYIFVVAKAQNHLPMDGWWCFQNGIIQAIALELLVQVQSLFQTMSDQFASMNSGQVSLTTAIPTIHSNSFALHVNDQWATLMRTTSPPCCHWKKSLLLNQLRFGLVVKKDRKFIEPLRDKIWHKCSKE